MNEIYRILVCDDQHENLVVAGNLLRDKGYELALSRDANEMFGLLDDFDPHLILLDIMMPGMDGLEACKLLKSNEKTQMIPVIFITAKHESQDIVNGFDAGGVDYITKPFNSTELLARVKTHLEQHLANQLIQKQTQELAKLNQSKDQIFSIIGHDMRTPLASIKMLLQVVKKTDPCEKKDSMQELFLLLEASADESYQMVENLLLWSRGQIGNIKPVPVKFILNDQISKIVHANHFLIKQKSLEIDFNPNIRYLVFADEEMVKAIIRNLLSNAIKFSKPNGKIIIQMENLENSIQVSVKDFGMGMSSLTISKVLSEIEYFTTPGTKGEKGNGVGTKICKKFIEVNGGAYWIESSEGIGTTVYFTLPKANLKSL